MEKNILKKMKTKGCLSTKIHKTAGICKDGFSMPELIIALAISVLILLATGNLIRIILVYFGSAQSSQFSQDDSVNVLGNMIDDLRTASISNTGNYPLFNVGTSTLGFYSDMTGSGIKEQIFYYLKGTTMYGNFLMPSSSPLQYLGASTTKVLIRNIANNSSTPIFQYYDQNYTGTSSPLAQPVDIEDVTLIKITAIVNTTLNGMPSTTTVTSQVSLRNLKTNL